MKTYERKVISISKKNDDVENEEDLASYIDTYYNLWRIVYIKERDTHFRVILEKEKLKPEIRFNEQSTKKSRKK